MDTTLTKAKGNARRASAVPVFLLSRTIRLIEATEMIVSKTTQGTKSAIYLFAEPTDASKIKQPISELNINMMSLRFRFPKLSRYFTEEKTRIRIMNNKIGLNTKIPTVLSV